MKRSSSPSSSSSKQKGCRILETEEDEEESGGGRGQILIKGMEACSKSRQVMFSNRRDALLRKAQELATLCDSQVGLIIFACTGQLYEYSSTSMKEVIERYNDQKGSHQASVDGASDIKVLQEEVAGLKLQVRDLQESKRQLMGEISDLSTKDLQILENQLELSLSTVRLRKDQLRSDHINKLHLKKNQVHQENVELKRRMDQIDNKEAELNEKFYTERRSSAAADNICRSINGMYNLNVPTEYFYTTYLPPGRDDDDQTLVTTDLGLTLPRSSGTRTVEDED